LLPHYQEYLTTQQTLCNEWLINYYKQEENRMDILTIIREADAAIKTKGLDKDQAAIIRMQILNSDEYWDENHISHKAVVNAAYMLTDKILSSGESNSDSQESSETSEDKTDPENRLNELRAKIIDTDERKLDASGLAEFAKVRSEYDTLVQAFVQLGSEETSSEESSDND
jgi:hypothetical protein